MKTLVLPNGKLKDRIQAITDTINDLLWYGHSSMYSIISCQWPSGLTAYPHLFNPKKMVAFKRNQQHATLKGNQSSFWSSQKDNFKTVKVKQDLTLYYNLPRIFRHPLMNINAGMYLTVARGRPIILINQDVEMYYPYLTDLPARRHIFDYNIHDLSDVEDWAKQINIWMKDRSMKPNFKPMESEAA